MDVEQLREFATRYTAAWGSKNPANVAAFYAEGGSLKINNAPPSVGRSAITTAAKGFMTDFPDLVVKMDGVNLNGNQAIYRWTLTGTNTGPGGSGRAVHMSGYEEWTLGPDGLIAESKGYFDKAEYNRQYITVNWKAGNCRKRLPPNNSLDASGSGSVFGNLICPAILD